MLDLDAKKAALRAEYVGKYAGAAVLRKDHVRSAITKAVAKRNEKTGYNAAWVLEKLAEVARRCMEEVKPALHPKTREPMKDDEGNTIFTFNAASAIAALTAMMKHVDVDAMASDKVQVTDGKDLVDRINAGRKRAYRQPVEHRPRTGCDTLVKGAQYKPGLPPRAPNPTEPKPTTPSTPKVQLAPVAPPDTAEQRELEAMAMGASSTRYDEDEE